MKIPQRPRVYLCKYCQLFSEGIELESMLPTKMSVTLTHTPIMTANILLIKQHMKQESQIFNWYTTYTVEGLRANYTANLHGYIRYIDFIDDEITPYGPIIISRGSWTNSLFNNPDERGLFQDYQMEVYFERAPGKQSISIPYGEMVYAGAADFDSETVQSFVLDGFKIGIKTVKISVLIENTKRPGRQTMSPAK